MLSPDFIRLTVRSYDAVEVLAVVEWTPTGGARIMQATEGMRAALQRMVEWGFTEIVRDGPRTTHSDLPNFIPRMAAYLLRQTTLFIQVECIGSEVASDDIDT